MIKNAFKILNQYIQKDENVLIAVSGGVDSMVLLDVSRQYFDKQNIFVVSVDHSVRENSFEDINLVKAYCNKYGLSFFTEKLLWKDDEKQTEEVMRLKRYNILQEYTEKFKSKFILTAHHLDDRFETFLFRLVRGAGLNGLLSPKYKENNILRPLLDIRKKDIIEYALESKVSWNEDITNNDTRYARNNIRHNVIENLEKIHPTAVKNFQTLIHDLEAWDTFHKKYIEKWLESHPIPFLCKDFLELPSIIQTELISELVRKHGEVLTRGHLEEVLKIIRSGIGGKCVKLKCGVEVCVREKKVWIENY